MVSSINMSRNRLVNIVPYGTKVFSKSVRKTSARFIDVKFATFTARNAVNDVGGGVERGYHTHLLDSVIQKAFNNSRRDTLKPPLAKCAISPMSGGIDSRKRHSSPRA